MNASQTQNAERVVLHALVGFAESADGRESLVEYLTDLRPLLSETSPEAHSDQEGVEDPLAVAVREAIATFDWLADDDQSQAAAQLFRGCAVLCDLEARGEAVQTALVEALKAEPEAGHDRITLAHLGQLARELPAGGMKAVLVHIPDPDWTVQESAAALLRLKTELNEVALDRTGEQITEIKIADVQQAVIHSGLADSRAAFIAWLNSDPEFAQVKHFADWVISFPRPKPNAALGAWAERHIEEERTAIALALLDRGMPLKEPMSAVCQHGIDQARVAGAAAKLIRKAASVSDRKNLATTLSGVEFTDQKARKQLVGLLKTLLGPNRPHGDEGVFGILLFALAPTLLEEPEKLEAVIKKARNRKKAKLKLTEEQGRRLHRLGIELKSNWFGKGTAKALAKWTAQLPRPI